MHTKQPSYNNAEVAKSGNTLQFVVLVMLGRYFYICFTLYKFYLCVYIKQCGSQ